MRNIELLNINNMNNFQRNIDTENFTDGMEANNGGYLRHITRGFCITLI